MTVREKFEQIIESNGISNTNAKLIMDEVIESMSTDKNHVLWNGSEKNYSKEFYAVVMVAAVNPIAVKWIEKNHPEAHYKLLFM